MDQLRYGSTREAILSLLCMVRGVNSFVVSDVHQVRSILSASNVKVPSANPRAPLSSASLPRPHGPRC
jgi:hypothetical protein